VYDAATGTTTYGPPVHAGGYNYVYADSHVKFKRPEATIGKGTLVNPLGDWTLDAND
jgi:prepilin-type processing-associated H-X9-DG protein